MDTIKMRDLENIINAYRNNLEDHYHMKSFLNKTTGTEKKILKRRIKESCIFLKNQKGEIEKMIQEIKLEIIKRKLDLKIYG